MKQAAGKPFDDPVGDATGGGPDIREVQVVNGVNPLEANGLNSVGIGVYYANRKCATSGDFVYAWLNVDQNAATGDPGGFEYVLYFDGPTGTRGVFRWNGASYTPIPVPNLTFGCDANGYDFWYFPPSELGIGDGFNFYVDTRYVDSTGIHVADVAPNTLPKLWTYQLESVPPPPPPTTVTTTVTTTPPPPTPPPAKAYSDAPFLPPRIRYAGQSIKHVRLGERMYATMKELGSIGIRPRLVAIACWSKQDWPSVLDSIGAKPTRENISISGFWLARQPHWIHLAPKQCADIQGLMDDRQPNGQRAYALATALHERIHAEGVLNEAQTNCYAVQLVGIFANQLGFVPTKARSLSQLALNKTVATAPRGYWDRSRCRTGGPWDLSSR